MGTYLRSNVGEYLLLLLSVWSVSTVGFNAFHLDSLLESVGYGARSLIALVVCAVLLVVLYAASFRRKRLVVGAVGYAALLAVLVAVALALSSGGNPYDDVEGNYLYLVLVMAFAATGGFLLTRTLAGSAVWFVTCAFVCSVVQAFYETGEVAMSVVATMSGLALIVHRNFRLGLVRSDVARRPSRAGILAASVMPVCAVGALALGVWFGVIAPLDPGVQKITLITDYRQLPTQEMKGTADEHPVFNFDMKSDDLVDGFAYTTDDLKEDPNSPTVIDARSVLEQQQQQQAQDESSGSGRQNTLDEDSPQEEYNAVSWSEVFPYIIVAIVVTMIVVAAIVAYFLVRRYLRMRRLRGMLSRPPREQVESLYLFLLGRLGRLGFRVPAGATLSEFSASSARSMDMLTEETRVPFDELTRTYQACVYGRREPTDDEVVPFVAYYLSFWKAVRTHLGNLKYFFKSFRL